MRLSVSLVLIAVFSWFSAIPTAQGQLIRINPNGFGGVNIRAPFVRINTTPYGPSHVRAPFVNVNPGAPYYTPQPYYQPQPVPYGSATPGYAPGPAPGYAPGQVMYESQVPGSAVTPGISTDIAPATPASNGINRPSSPPSNQPAESTRPMIPRANPPAETRRPVTPIEAGDADTPAPAPAPEMAAPELKSVLEPQLLSDQQAEDLRSRLIASTRDLDQSLSVYSNAQAWQEHLRLPQFLLDASTPLKELQLNDEQVVELEKIVTRFDRTSERADLNLVNQFDSFRRVNQQLRQLSQYLNETLQISSEELPVPAPDSDDN
ncbi:MAG: hypothetical protein ACR2NP_07680 [Pirellulaceae bacterium]